MIVQRIGARERSHSGQALDEQNQPRDRGESFIQPRSIQNRTHHLGEFQRDSFELTESQEENHHDNHHHADADVA